MTNQNISRARARSMVKIVYVVLQYDKVIACYTTEARAKERALVVNATVVPVHLEV